MNVYIDESGSFVSTSSANSWNCVAAYASPEVDTRKIRDVLLTLKHTTKKPPRMEIKLNDITEENYIIFLKKLNRLNGTLYSVATDASLNKISEIKAHQQIQVEEILKHISKMLYEGGRQGVQLLADQIESLSPQLYAQLYCQVTLISDFIQRGIAFYVQRHPKSLSKFRWRIDQKNSDKPIFEEAFEKLTPALLQTISLREPLIMIRGEDYSAFDRYYYAEDENPTYLRDTYGIDIGDNPQLNIGKIIREDIRFENSKSNLGVQIVDLLASGIRRCLRGDFKKNNTIARYLAGLMVQQAHNQPPIHLIAFAEGQLKRDSAAYNATRLMMRFNQPLLIHKSQ